MTLDLETIRDLVIILYGILGLVLMIILVTAALGIWFAIRSVSYTHLTLPTKA